MRPLAIDLFTGLHGFGNAIADEGWSVVGFDIEDMCAQFGEPRHEHVQLVIQDVMTLHGSQFADADLIVASPPCQEFSYMAMPWGRAKKIAGALRGEDEFPAGYTGSRTLADLTALFDACFRIQREASEAAGRHIPMVVENVRGAIPWVGRSRWAFGSFHFWGDVPALMPVTRRAVKVPSRSGRRTDVGNGARFTSRDCGIEGAKNPGFRFDGSGRSFQTESVERHVGEGRKVGGDWFSDPTSPSRTSSSKSSARKAASARIAKIPEAISRYIARVYLPRERIAA